MNTPAAYVQTDWRNTSGPLSRGMASSNDQAPPIGDEEDSAQEQATGYGKRPNFLRQENAPEATEPSRSSVVETVALAAMVVEQATHRREKLLETHALYVEAIEGNNARVTIQEGDQRKVFLLSIDGMKQAGAGRVDVDDHFMLKIFKQGIDLRLEFVKQEQAAIIPFSDTEARPLAPDLLRFQREQLKRRNDFT